MTRPELPVEAELAPRLTRVVAPNPSMMTGPGTNTYVVGEHELAVVDPGPAIDVHLDRIVDRPGRIRWIFVTHTHPDHSPGACVLAERTGAELIGRPPPDGEHQDATFEPAWIIDDGESLETEDFTLVAVRTPGHASNHVCYLHGETGWLMTGDHVIDGSTVVINPPDGNMRDYLDSLRRVLDLDLPALLPGHGERIDEPARVIDGIIAHRLKREAKVALALSRAAATTVDALVGDVYEDVPSHLHAWAACSLKAHLIKLVDDGRATVDGDVYRWTG
jgi:glyoxylase-like metal-dependent hydrolase (beta-lactamase superfamily II)